MNSALPDRIADCHLRGCGIPHRGRLLGGGDSPDERRRVDGGDVLSELLLGSADRTLYLAPGAALRGLGAIRSALRTAARRKKWRGFADTLG